METDDQDRASCTLREAEYEDCEPATALLRELGLVIPGQRDDIRSHWRRFWIDNPALAVAESPPGRGWLLEDDGAMVGFFGNVPLLYDYAGQPVIVACASKWGVAKPYRSETARLADCYFKQKNVDLLLVTTGIKPTGRIFRRYGGLPVPQPAYDHILFWILDPAAYLKAGLIRKGTGPRTASLACRLGGPVLTAITRMAKSNRIIQKTKIDIVEIGRIDDEFDDLWRRKRDEANRFYACRSAECLRWHFGAASLAEKTRILVCRTARGLGGYVAVMREDVPEIGLKRLKIVDLFVANNDENVIDNLLQAAREVGISDGCHVLELIGLPIGLRQEIIRRQAPWSRKMPVWPVFYKGLTDDFRQPSGSEDFWYVTAYDGDTAIF